MKAPQAPQSGPAMRSPHEHQSQSKMAKGAPPLLADTPATLQKCWLRRAE